METKVENNNSSCNNGNKVLDAVLEYVQTEAKKLYDTRMNDNVDYEIIMEKVDAFEIVEKHIKNHLKKVR